MNRRNQPGISRVVTVHCSLYVYSFHRTLLDLIDRLPAQHGKRAFVFSTRGMPADFNGALQRKLDGKGFTVLGSISFKGHDIWGPFKLAGGLNKGHPDAADLKDAASFARSLKEQMQKLEKKKKPVNRRPPLTS